MNESVLKAVNYISETGAKDYKNSIKESVTALEELTNILNGSNGLPLSVTIEQLCSKVHINENLKNLIKSLYKYASDTNGIRHGNNKNNDDNITFDEAKLVLLICSSATNYLVSLGIDHASID